MATPEGFGMYRKHAADFLSLFRKRCDAAGGLARAQVLLIP
jgi:hypothetical protein